MSTKQYTICRLLITMMLAALVSISVVQGFVVLPIVSVLAAIALLWYCRARTKSILADERDYKISGQAARYAISVYAIPAALASVVFITLREQNSAYEIIGHVLAYSVCFLLLVQSFIFKYLART